MTYIGLILVLIGGILAIVGAVLDFLDLDIFTGSNFIGGLEGLILGIVCGVLLIMIYQGRIDISGLALGIVVLILGILGDTVLAIIGGILIIVDEFL